VEATPNVDGWICKVRIEDGGRTVSEHAVTVTKADKERFAPQATVEDLVTRSFEFLLEREPPTSILRTFALPDIERYFPDFPTKIRF
jgi:DNA-binding protein